MVGSSLGFLFLFTILVRSSSSLPNQPTVSFVKGFFPLFGNQNVVPYDDGKSVSISMDQQSSSGFKSQQTYIHGLFSSSIKLPQGDTAGVVVTFYTSNNQKYPNNHDEIDFEFLGHVIGQNWVMQTNFYGSESTQRGREERYVLSFDPSEDFHQYSILWTENRIIYYVDGIPIRVVQRSEAMGGDWPSKPMTLYATIWNGSDWATNGGRHKVDFINSPYVAKYSDFVLNGCPIDPITLLPKCEENPGFNTIPSDITADERINMNHFRRKCMTYSYCCDRKRYPVPFPECSMN